MKTKLLLALLLCFTLTTTASAQKKSKIDRKGIISYQELKEAKELLELEVISQEEYDQIKNSLNNYILKK